MRVGLATGSACARALHALSLHCRPPSLGAGDAGPDSFRGRVSCRCGALRAEAEGLDVGAGLPGRGWPALFCPAIAGGRPLVVRGRAGALSSPVSLERGGAGGPIADLRTPQTIIIPFAGGGPRLPRIYRRLGPTPGSPPRCPPEPRRLCTGLCAPSLRRRTIPMLHHLRGRPFYAALRRPAAPGASAGAGGGGGRRPRPPRAPHGLPR